MAPRAMRFGRLAGPALLAVLLAPLASAQGDAGPEPNLVAGLLDWVDGKGAITWTTTKGPAEVVPPNISSPATLLLADAGWWARTQSGGDDRGLIPRVDFTSGPLPETLYVNGSRRMELGLAFKTPCPRTDYGDVDAELWMGNRLIAGRAGLSGYNPYPGYPRPGSGPNTCFYRAAMHPEEDVLPKGATLRIILLFHQDNLGSRPATAPTFVLGGASSLLFITYSPDEILFRRPEFQGTPDAFTSDGDAAPTPGLLFALPLLAVGRRRGAKLLLAVLVVGSLAGCVGDRGGGASSGTPNPGVGGSLDTRVIDDPANETGLANATHGTLVGQVRNDQRVPIEGAHVALLGSPNATRTGLAGTFRLDGISPGRHTLRVDREGYVSFEGDVQIDAGVITRADVSLEPLVKQPDGFRPHRHDYWAGETTKLAFATTIRTAGNTNGVASPGACQPVPGAFGVTVPGSGCHWAFLIPPNDDPNNPATIIPGTEEVEITIKWTPAPHINLERVMIWFYDNSENGRKFPMHLYPKGNGVPTRIKANWEMTDDGHQSFSTWSFGVSVYHPQNNQGVRPAILLPDLAVTVRLHKGVLPLEAPHRDFWRDGPQVGVLDQAPLEARCQPTCNYPFSNTHWQPLNLTPPGTARLKIRLEWDTISLPAPVDWGLLYKPANIRPQPPNDFTQFKKLEPTTRDPKFREYELNILPIEADPFYASRSNWVYQLDDNDPDGQTYVNGPITLRLTVVAIKGADAASAKDSLGL